MLIDVIDGQTMKGTVEYKPRPNPDPALRTLNGYTVQPLSRKGASNTAAWYAAGERPKQTVTNKIHNNPPGCVAHPPVAD